MRTLRKLTLPRTSRVHLREHLFRRLDCASRGGVVWVHGPPGSGKTVLVSSWLTHRSIRGLWLQLDSGDADEATLFHYLRLAASRLLPNAKIPEFTMQSLVAPGTFARLFFRELFAARAAPMLLVLDDYHALPGDCTVHGRLAEGLEECPPSARVIVISRHEPPPSWARLRLRERLEQIEPEELVLSEDESAAIVALRTRHHDRAFAEILHKRSAGWVAGLVLLLQAESKPDELNPDESVFDFIAEEVLARVDEETRAVLFATALLPDISADMAVKLTGVARAGQILAKMARRGYFTFRLAGASSYRYHPLFRQFLMQRASAEWGDHRVRAVQGRAARLLAEAGDMDVALELAVQSHAWEELELNEALRWSEQTGYRPGEFACRLWLAKRALAAGLRDDACQHLAAAFDLGQRFGFMNAVNLRAEDLSELCALAVERGIEPVYVRALIQRRRVPAGEHARELPGWPWSIRILALEGMSIEGEYTKKGTRKSRKMPLALLQLLIDAGPRGGRLEQIAAELWPDADGDRAVQAFHTTLHRLRALLGDPQAVLHKEGRFMLNAHKIYVDVWALERLLDRADRLERGHDQENLLHERAQLRAKIAELWNPVVASAHPAETMTLRRLHRRLQQMSVT